jgi:hypothetical protein
VLRELVSRVEAVEKQLELVASQARVTPDPTMAEHVDELVERVTRLRAGIDALQAGRG